MTVKALIVDDEEWARINLQLALQEMSTWQIVGLCDSVESATSVLAQQTVDVVFLDIQMPEVSGLTLARDLTQQATSPVIIFVTAFDRFALDAFEYFALDYLLKPISNSRLQISLKRAQEVVEMREKSGYRQSLCAYLQADQTQHPYLKQVTLRSVGEIELLSLDKVNYISSAGNYLELYTNEGSKLLRLTMNHLEAKLDPDIFVRIHRSHIVKMNHIEKIHHFVAGAARLTLQCGTVLPISQAYWQKLKDKMSAIADYAKIPTIY